MCVLDKTRLTGYLTASQERGRLSYMAKIDAAKEKALRNEEYAEKFKRPKKKVGRQPSKFLNWCRTQGHPGSCSCTLPDPAEIRGGRR
jgi:hypothetical protein